MVHIQVNDVNEFSPVFREPLYKASLTEGKIYDSILQVGAALKKASLMICRDAVEGDSDLDVMRICANVAGGSLGPGLLAPVQPNLQLRNRHRGDSVCHRPQWYVCVSGCVKICVF